MCGVCVVIKFCELWTVCIIASTDLWCKERASKEFSNYCLLKSVFLMDTQMELFRARLKLLVQGQPAFVPLLRGLIFILCLQSSTTVFLCFHAYGWQLHLIWTSVQTTVKSRQIDLLTVSCQRFTSEEFVKGEVSEIKCVSLGMSQKLQLHEFIRFFRYFLLCSCHITKQISYCLQYLVLYCLTSASPSQSSKMQLKQGPEK